MDEQMVTLELPAPVYADLEALAASERQTPADIIAEWVEVSRQRHAWLQGWQELRDLVRQNSQGQLPPTKEEIVEQMRKTRQEIWEAEYAHLYR